jgi:hypothetical protein
LFLLLTAGLCRGTYGKVARYVGSAEGLARAEPIRRQSLLKIRVFKKRDELSVTREGSDPTVTHVELSNATRYTPPRIRILFMNYSVHR